MTKLVLPELGHMLFVFEASAMRINHLCVSASLRERLLVTR